MTKLEFLGALGVAYLLLLARSAWRQGEIRQFLVSLVTVLALVAVLTAITAAVIYLDGN